MERYRAVRTFFWNIDPGYFNLKQAGRTIFAILVTLWLVREDLLLTKMMAGVGCGIAMQGVATYTFRMRLTHVVIFSFIYFAAFSLGLWARNSPVLTAFLLTALAFSVNYMRRFDLEKSVAPFMVWLLCFLATILPFGNTKMAWAHIYGLVVGLLVAAGVVLFLFPNNYQYLFRKNTKLFLLNLSLGLRQLAGEIGSSANQSGLKTEDYSQSIQNLSRLNDSNQTILNSPALRDKEALLSEITAYLYAGINAYDLVVHASQDLGKQTYPFSKATKDALSAVLIQLADYVDQIDINASFKFVSASKTHFRPQLGERLGKQANLVPDLLMGLLNFKLGLELLSQNIFQLTRNDHAT